MKKTAKNSKRIPQRSPDQTTLTVSLPVELKQMIEAASKKDGRSISNFMVRRLAEMFATEDGKPSGQP